MSLALSFRKSFKKNLRLLLLILAALPVFVYGQSKHAVKHIQSFSYTAPGGNLKTAATATCPTSLVILKANDTLTNNTIANGHVFECDKAPFYLEAQSTVTDITVPCITTEYNTFHNNLATNGSETIYEGGADYGCVGPSASCSFPIGNGSIAGLQWGLVAPYLDPNQQHDFVFCRQGTITTTTISLTDCWTGNIISSTPTTPVNFSNTNPPNTSTCFTLTVPANTDIGTAVYTITPASASALIDYHDGDALIDPSVLPVGSYTVGYSFTPSSSSGCGVVTGTFKFSIVPSVTVAVNSPTVCAGNTATLTANASSGTTPYTYSWTPSAGLSATTGSVVTVSNPTVATNYTVTVTDRNGCTSVDTAVISLTTFTVNKATICSGNSATLTASDNSFTYNWTPSASLNTAASATVIATPTATTVYTVTATNAACPTLTLTVTDSVIVNVSPTITVLSPTVCSGTTATITAVGATSYTWSPLTNLTHSVTNDTVYISNPTTNLTYTAYGVGLNGCKDSAVSNVTASTYLGILSGTPITECFGTPFSLSAIGASTYTWTSNDPANLDFGHDTSWVVQSSIANVGTYTLGIYGESHSGTFCSGNATVTVTINPTPTVTVVGDPTPAICSGTSTTLTVNSSGPPITAYGWFPATGLSTPTSTINSAVASPTVTTVYLATGTAASGCSSNTTFTVNVIPVPSFTVNSTSFCLGGSDSLKVVPTTTTSGAQNYSWTPATGLSPTAGTAVAVTSTVQGTYTYSVVGTNTILTSAVTCSTTATSTVTVIPLPTVTVVPTSPSCAGATATLTAGGSATSYNWSPATTPTTGSVVTANPLTTTVYTVTGSDGGCTATQTVTQIVNPLPTFTITNSKPAFCLGDSSVLSITTSTVAAAYTLISNGGLNTSITNSITVHPTTTTFYTVNATSTTGSCPSVQTTTVVVNTLPTVTVAPTNTVICAGSPAILTAGGLASYTWGSSSTTYTAVTNTLVDAPSITTTYTVTGQSAFGCHAVDTATATITVTTVTATANSNSPVCKGQSINLSVSTNGTTYSWSATNGYSSTGVQNPTISNATTINSAVYSVTVALGACTATRTVAVVVDSPTVTISPNAATICLGQTTNLTASGTGITSYTWTPSTGLNTSNGSSVTAGSSATTVYSVIGSDGTCLTPAVTATVSVDSVVAHMVASPETGDAPLNVSFGNQSVNADTYYWNFGNGSNTTTSNLSDSAKTIYPTVGTYTAVLTVSGTTGGLTCADNDTVLIIVTENYSLVIPNVFSPNGDGINDNYILKGEGISTFSMEIFDRWGLKMFSSTSINLGWDGKTMGGKDAADGTYFYIINATSSKTNKSQEYKGFLTLIK